MSPFNRIVFYGGPFDGLLVAAPSNRAVFSAPLVRVQSPMDAAEQGLDTPSAAKFAEYRDTGRMSGDRRIYEFLRITG